MANFLRTTGYVSLVACIAAGCQSTPDKWSKQTNERISKDLAAQQKAIKTQDLPPAVRNAILPNFKLDISPELAKTEHRFDLVVKQAPVRDVYLSLVSGTPYSVALDNDVKGSVTLQLKNVTVEDAFKAIREAYGFTFTRTKNQFAVYGKGMRSRIFKVNYLNVVRSGSSSTRVVSGELRDKGGGGGSSSGGSTSSSNASNSQGNEGGNSSGASMDGGVGVATTYTHDFWSGLRASLESLVGTEDGRRIVISPESGLVVIKATPEELALVEQYLSVSHKNVAQQVVLEAKIMEVELNDGFQAGINWAQLTSAGPFKATSAQIGGGSILTGSGVSEIAGSNTANLITSNISNAKTSAFGGIFSLALAGSNFSSFLELIRTQGDIQVLSSPRVSTVTNQKAVIKVGGEEFYITNISSSTSTTGTTTSGSTSQAVQFTPFFSGISLDVTPQIEDGEYITLHLHSTVSEVTQRNKNFVVSSNNYNVPLAASTIRESDNIVRAKNGQIIVVGGLMKETTTDDEASIPFLGSLPFIGNLFKQKKVARVKKELVMLIKPTVVDGSQYWAQDVTSTLDRFEDLKR